MAAEKTIERKLVQAVHLMGGLALKFVSPGLDGCIAPRQKGGFCGIESPWKENASAAGTAEKSNRGPGLFGVLHRQAGADWRSSQ